MVVSREELMNIIGENDRLDVDNLKAIETIIGEETFQEMRKELKSKGVKIII